MIYGNVIVYGAHLTRKYQNLMAYEKGAYNLQTHKGAPVPMIFITKEAWDKARHVGEWKTVADMLGAMKPEYRSFVRGITSLPATNKTEIRKAAGFVKTIEETEGEAIAELQELAQSRGLIKE